jgi:hypothetical protein
LQHPSAFPQLREPVLRDLEDPCRLFPRGQYFVHWHSFRVARPESGPHPLSLDFANDPFVGVDLFQSEFLFQRFIEPSPQQDRESSGFLSRTHVYAENMESVVRSFSSPSSADQELSNWFCPTALANT